MRDERQGVFRPWRWQVSQSVDNRRRRSAFPGITNLQQFRRWTGKAPSRPAGIAAPGPVSFSTYDGGRLAIGLEAWVQGRLFPCRPGGAGAVVLVWGLNAGGPPTWWLGVLDLNDVPAVTYSPTPSRVQYHRRCGS